MLRFFHHTWLPGSSSPTCKWPVSREKGPIIGLYWGRWLQGPLEFDQQPALHRPTIYKGLVNRSASRLDEQLAHLECVIYMTCPMRPHIPWAGQLRCRAADGMHLLERSARDHSTRTQPRSLGSMDRQCTPTSLPPAIQVTCAPLFKPAQRQPYFVTPLSPSADPTSALAYRGRTAEHYPL